MKNCSLRFSNRSLDCTSMSLLTFSDSWLVCSMVTLSSNNRCACTLATESWACSVASFASPTNFTMSS